jgi:hypothetical protein
MFYSRPENKHRQELSKIWNEYTDGVPGEKKVVEVAQGRKLTIPKFHEGIKCI